MGWVRNGHRTEVAGPKRRDRSGGTEMAGPKWSASVQEEEKKKTKIQIVPKLLEGSVQTRSYSTQA